MIFSGHQPQFLPYMGVLYKIYKSDVFVFDDDVQYSKAEYQSSNFIKVQGVKHKISVPVRQEFGQLINEAEICNDYDWQKKMLKKFETSYKKAEHFNDGYELLEKHLNMKHQILADLNLSILMDIIDRFGFDTKIVIASKDVPTELTKNDRNIFQCKKLGCNLYYSGIGGKEYNDEDAYRKEGIEIAYSDYKPIRYRQVGDDFIENLSCIDYIMNEGFSIPKDWNKLD